MRFGAEHEIAACLRRGHRPTSQCPGHLNDVGLRVAAVDTQCVQFHQFASIVFVYAFGTTRGQPGRQQILTLYRLRQRQLAKLDETIRRQFAEAIFLLRREQVAIHQLANRHLLCTSRLTALQARGTVVHRNTTWLLRLCDCWATTIGDALPVVEIGQHGGAFCHCAQQRAELAHRVRANRVLFKLRQVIPGAILSGEQVEMILPEVDHDFIQLTFARNGSCNFRAGEFSHDAIRLLRGRSDLERIGRRKITPDRCTAGHHGFVLLLLVTPVL